LCLDNEDSGREDLTNATDELVIVLKGERESEVAGEIRRPAT
jgi:hypothetical protein